jgi:glycosyltransferase involved in cell wall biosynthesis
MKVLIGLTEVSGFYSHLHKGLMNLGVNVEFVSIFSHPYAYGEMNDTFFPRFSRYCVRKRGRSNHIWSRCWWTLMVGTSRFLLFIWAVVKFDVFILGGGSSFFRFFEFPILHLLGKKIIYMFHGTDSRPAYIDGFCKESVLTLGPPNIDDESSNHHTRKRNNAQFLLNLTRQRKRDVAIIEKYADIIINHPPYSHFLTRPFVHALAIGVPSPSVELSPTELHSKGSLIRILHCPSHPDAKGTLVIRAAIASLVEKGYEIEYIELSGRPNAEVIDEIDKCDFIVDQAYSDTPMAGFAAEAASLEKPAVVGGYYSCVIGDEIPSSLIPPSRYCHPNNIEKEIEYLIVNQKQRELLGKNAKQFVSDLWSPDSVAKNFLRILKDDVPESWFTKPEDTDYIFGAGISKESIKANIRMLVDSFDESALCLDHKPKLKKLFLDFSKQ